MVVWGAPLPLLEESISESQKKKLYGDVFAVSKLRLFLA